VKKGPKLPPLVETLPKKHDGNFTLRNAKLSKLTKSRLKI